MKDITISSQELKEKNAIILPSKAKEFAKQTFWYYTSMCTADLILQNKCIHVSNIETMNDLDEIEIHNKDKDIIHCLCFCNSNTEKIPMWYLYAGITGKGVSIGLTPSVMMNFLKSIDKAYSVDGKVILNKGRDFDIDFGWVFYRKKEQPTQVMYKNKWYSLSDPKNFESYNYFIKSYPWEYEKEFRIVFRNKTNTPFKKIVIKLDNIYPKLKLKMAPELSRQSFEESLKSLPGFMKYMSSIPKYSNLGIKMSLCKRNIDGFIDYYDMDLKKDENEREIESEKIDKICSIFKSASKCKECVIKET